MPPRKAAAPAAAASPADELDQLPFADAEARVRCAAETARRRLAALVGAARRVLAALAADPSAVETGARVDVDHVDDSMMIVEDNDAVERNRTSSNPKPLVLALSESVEDLLAARAALRASIEELQVAEAHSNSLDKAMRDAEAASRAALAASLEPAVAALRARVSRKNSAVAALSDSLASLVSDVDSWRVAGPGAWPKEDGDEAEGREE